MSGRAPRRSDSCQGGSLCLRDPTPSSKTQRASAARRQAVLLVADLPFAEVKENLLEAANSN